MSDRIEQTKYWHSHESLFFIHLYFILVMFYLRYTFRNTIEANSTDSGIWCCVGSVWKTISSSSSLVNLILVCLFQKGPLRRVEACARGGLEFIFNNYVVRGLSWVRRVYWRALAPSMLSYYDCTASDSPDRVWNLQRHAIPSQICISRS